MWFFFSIIWIINIDTTIDASTTTPLHFLPYSDITTFQSAIACNETISGQINSTKNSFHAWRLNVNACLQCNISVQSISHNPITMNFYNSKGLFVGKSMVFSKAERLNKLNYYLQIKTTNKYKFALTCIGNVKRRLVETRLRNIYRRNIPKSNVFMVCKQIS